MTTPSVLLAELNVLDTRSGISSPGQSLTTVPTICSDPGQTSKLFSQVIIHGRVEQSMLVIFNTPVQFGKHRMSLGFFNSWP
jgi:hypothetical protein